MTLQFIGGAWEQIKGKVLVGVDEGDSDFSTAGLTGGEKTHTLTTDEMPNHRHNLYGGCTSTSNNIADNSYVKNGWIPYLGGQSYTNANCVASTGSGSSHNNLQPYETVYIWKRTS